MKCSIFTNINSTLIIAVYHIFNIKQHLFPSLCYCNILASIVENAPHFYNLDPQDTTPYTTPPTNVIK